MKNRSEPARIAVPPTWAHESTLDEDSLSVVHDRLSETNFSASTGDLKTPLASQFLRLQVVDRLRVLRTGRENDPVGLVADREEVEVVLMQSEARTIELVTWSVDEARKVHKALGDLIDAYDATGGA